MRIKKNKYQFPTRVLTGILAVLTAVVLGAGNSDLKVYAASGTVYTCTVTPSYTHPVTGEIEDAGGEAGYATGQAMVGNIIYPTGILEVTDSGEYYLTIRMSMMDYTSGQSFWVQNVGDSGWSSPAMGVTGNGTDGNGTTADICIQVPSENSVVRCAMSVSAMGRDVIFYFYPSGYTQGNSTDMNATMVTTASGSDNSGTTQSGSGGQTTQSGSNSSGQSGSTTNSNNTSSSGSAGSTAGSNSALPASSSSSGSAEGTQSDDEDSKDENAAVLESSIQQAASPQTAQGSEDQLNEAQGLSLSTASDEEQQSGAAGTGSGSNIFLTALAVTLSGLILMGAAAGIIYLFRRNWRRWGGGEDDDE